MKRGLGAVVVGILVLGGCTWFLPPSPDLFPEEIAPGWRLDAEAALAVEDLPPGASGGWAACWKAGNAWIWAEVVTLGSAEASEALLAETVATFHEFQADRIGDEGVTLVHGPSGLVLHFFRRGPSLALVGSLAGSAGEAPSADLVRRAAQNLASRLPYTGAAVPARAGTGGPSPRSSGAPAVEIEVELRDSSGRGTATLTLRVYGWLVGESGGICSYRLAFHLARISLGDVPEDGPFRGPLDLFLAGSADLPCGRLTFVTEELAHLRPGEERVFDEPGPFLGELECAVPCWRPDIPLNLHIVLRNSDDDLLDLLKATILALHRAQPRAVPLWEAVEGLVRTYGPPAGSPSDPIRTAEGVRGTLVGGGEAVHGLPAEVYYGGVRLEFSGTLAIAGSCSRAAENVIQCRVPAGAAGTLALTAARIPAGAVSIRAESLPAGWPPFPARSGWGTLNAQYAFAVPLVTAGQRFELRFRAWTAGVQREVELRVILDVVPTEGIGTAQPPPGLT